MQSLRAAAHRRRRGQRRALHGHGRSQLPGAGRDPAEVQGRFGDPHGGSAQRGRGRRGHAAFAVGHAAQRLARLDGPGKIFTGRCERKLGDQRHLVTSLASHPRQVRLPPRPEHPLPNARIAFTQMVVEFADADEPVAVPVGGAAADPVGDQAGEGRRLGSCGRGDDDPALPFRGPGRPEVVSGVHRPAGPPVEQHHGLPGPAALQQHGELRDVECGVRRAAHHGVRPGEEKTTAGPGEHDAAEVEEDAVVLVTALEETLHLAERLRHAGIVQQGHVVSAEPRITEHLGEHGHVRGRHREPAQHRIIVVLDRHHHCQPSPAHRITLCPWCDVGGRHETPR
ncbi:hypothetical protein AB0F81_47335 [Actinoplanes sp. NPDC024001]|uniref:hypothetical protein n=1 Tax=Actinoplanes sp. NPDC024001 TaxID=3154598 RepID=UPI0033D52154